MQCIILLFFTFQVPGKSPEIMFYDSNNRVIEKIDIAEMSRDQLNQLMRDKGFGPAGSKHKSEDIEAMDENDVGHDEI